ncbi:MAG: amidohydrolase family protein [Coriobacteriales bacterium]|nr:amidohydrolase family protein [Coriobacteriales bacterium]
MLLSLGITDTLEGCTNYWGEDGFVAFKALEEKGLLTGNYHLTYRVNADNINDGLKSALAVRERIGGGKNYHLDTIKGFVDGVMETQTRRLIEPYENMKHPITGADYYGYVYDPCYTTEQVEELVTKANEAGFRTHFHTIGDAAVATAVDGIIAGQTSPKMRNAVTHLQLVPDGAIQKMAANNIVAVTNPYWHYKEDGVWDDELKYFGEKVELVSLINSLDPDALEMAKKEGS